MNIMNDSRIQDFLEYIVSHSCGYNLFLRVNIKPLKETYFKKLLEQ